MKDLLMIFCIFLNTDAPVSEKFQEICDKAEAIRAKKKNSFIIDLTKMSKEEILAFLEEYGLTEEDLRPVLWEENNAIC